MRAYPPAPVRMESAGVDHPERETGVPSAAPYLTELVAADSDEAAHLFQDDAAQGFRDDPARHSGMMPPSGGDGCWSSGFWH